MSDAMNYDPNMNFCGRITEQDVRLTFGEWDYRATKEVTVIGNVTGMSTIESAIARADLQVNGHLILERENGDTLSTEDDEDRGEDWLRDMLISAEIVAIRPAGTVGNPQTTADTEQP